MIDEPNYSSSNCWFYSLLVDKKRYGKSNLGLMKALAKRKIEARPVWYLNHKQKPYRNCQAYRIEKAKVYSKRVLNLPCSVNLTKQEINRIIKVIKNNVKK